MKHYIGPSQYSTYSRTSYASEMPIGNPAGSMISAINMGNRYNEQVQKDEAAKREQELARVANQEFVNSQTVRAQHEAEFNNASINNAMIGRARRGYEGYSQEELAAQHADLSEQMRTNFFGRYVANQGQLDAMYPEPYILPKTLGSVPYSNPNMTSPFQAGFGPFGNNGGF